MEKKCFTNNENRCFQMKFPNGLLVSMNVGACGYNDNNDSMNFDKDKVETDTVEVAVWDETDHKTPWMTKQFFPDAEDGEASVAGFISMEEFSQALIKIIGWKR